MKRIVRMIFILLVSFALILTAQEKKFKYVGVKKCKTCHNTKKIGKQYDIWSKGLHANALKSLSSEKSLEYAKKNNITDPTRDAKCLNCHSTAASVDKALLTKTITVEEGVSCESCHGPGSVYKKLKIMKNHEAAIANGLISPSEKVCVSCHNENNPFHKPFVYKTALTKVSHPIPSKKK